MLLAVLLIVLEGRRNRPLVAVVESARTAVALTEGVVARCMAAERPLLRAADNILRRAESIMVKHKDDCQIVYSQQ